ncbi:hypothetical protein FHR99_000039 [Litorivivens lipolytica]|uniref:Uncharacterized protein n=1 Tax=Litorivivens lipolytica TaxID=1524264 RepID=A0A7W4W1L8_9GAMM|nr:hypothetical protein [Litorivivens lipolytica]
MLRYTRNDGGYKADVDKTLSHHEEHSDAVISTCR